MRKLILTGMALAMLAIPAAASAAGGPSSGPVANQPGNSCFGNFRAGTVDAFHDVASDWAKGDVDPGVAAFFGITDTKVHMNDLNVAGKAYCAAAL